MTRVDTEAPTCGFCPTDITVENATGSEVRVNWDRPICTDNSGVLPRVSSNRESGSNFAVPSFSQVQYYVSDGNLEYTGCNFRVTVLGGYYRLCGNFNDDDDDNDDDGDNNNSFL